MFVSLSKIENLVTKISRLATVIYNWQPNLAATRVPRQVVWVAANTRLLISFILVAGAATT